MPEIARPSSVVLMIAIIVWGVVSTLLGAARGVGLDPDAPDAAWAGAFVFLAYYSVLIIGSFGIVAARVVSILLGLSAIFAFVILVLAQPFADGLGLGMSFRASLGAILRGPALVGLLLFVISRSERTQETRRAST
jgi:hypothetical protein